jgi:transcriptional antiterminator NusG
VDEQETNGVAEMPPEETDEIVGAGSEEALDAADERADVGSEEAMAPADLTTDSSVAEAAAGDEGLSLMPSESGEDADVGAALDETQDTSVQEPEADPEGEDEEAVSAADEPDIDDGDLSTDAETDADAEEPAAEGGEEAGPDRQWYVVHGYSGFENRVKKNLEQRIESMGMQDTIFQVVVPTEEEIEIRGGERRIVEKRVFPGYILVEMVMNETSWYVVRNTPGVTGFVGTGTRPTPLSTEEVNKIMKRIESAEPTIKVSFKVGQKVRLTEGAFADFVGRVDELYPEKGRAKVSVAMFGRETPLEVDILHLERV